MKTITAVRLVEKSIKQGLTNDQIRELPQFVRLNYRVNDKQIDNLRKDINS